MSKLNQHGWRDWQVWSIMLFNLCVTNALVGFIYAYCQEDLAPFSVKTIWQVLVNMAMTEVLFTSAHALLHYTKWGSKIHEMHHCCIDPSWSTNLMFHPVDLAAEFSGPVISLILMHMFVWRDTATLFASTLILHLWYAADHSANLKLPHTKHHSQLNTVFTIYLKQRCRCPRKDKVRAIIKQNTMIKRLFDIYRRAHSQSSSSQSSIVSNSNANLEGPGAVHVRSGHSDFSSRPPPNIILMGSSVAILIECTILEPSACISSGGRRLHASMYRVQNTGSCMKGGSL